MKLVSSLPQHGLINCRKCFSTPGEVEETGLWQAVNDPGAWGSITPRVLVLGFSKGFVQAGAYRGGDFNAIPFKGMRPRLTAALRRLGLLLECEAVESKFSPNEQDFAFGSLVRCSLSRLNEKTKRRECTGAVMPKAFSEPIQAVVNRCAQTFLSDLPPSVSVVVMLGNGDSYIDGCRRVVQSLYGSRYKLVNDVAYETDRVIWVHVAHPSGMNGHFDRWLTGSATEKSGRKLLLALESLSGSKDVARKAA